jgi:hypothetical protein
MNTILLFSSTSLLHIAVILLHRPFCNLFDYGILSKTVTPSRVGVSVYLIRKHTGTVILCYADNKYMLGVNICKTCIIISSFLFNII